MSSSAVAMSHPAACGQTAAAVRATIIISSRRQRLRIISAS